MQKFQAEPLKSHSREVAARGVCFTLYPSAIRPLIIDVPRVPFVALNRVLMPHPRDMEAELATHYLFTLH